MAMKEECVWVFNGEGAALASAVFSSREDAEQWIAKTRVSGLLTAYPIGESAYEWAVRLGHFTPKRDDQRAPAFIQRFTSASQPHFHFTDGVPQSR